MSFFRKVAGDIVSPERLARMEQVLEERTRFVVPVFENLYKPHNASAVVRTCDALGINRVHFIEEQNSFEFHSDIAQGSHKWVEAETSNSVAGCFDRLRRDGYAVVGTALSPRAVPPQEIPLDRPVALVFGNELKGIAPKTAAACDMLVQIPMYGFVDSFNISVAAALLLQGLLQRLRNSGAVDWKLSDAEKRKVMQRWLFYNTKVGTVVTGKRHLKQSPRRCS